MSPPCALLSALFPTASLRIRSPTILPGIDPTLPQQFSPIRARGTGLVTVCSGPPGPNPAANLAVPYGSYYNYATYCGLAGTPGQYCLDPVDELDSWGLSNDLELNPAENLTVKSISAYRKLDQTSAADTDGSPFSRNMSLWTIQYEQFTQELRLNGRIGSLADWTVGGYYFLANARQGGRISIDGAGDNLIPFFYDHGLHARRSGAHPLQVGLPAHRADPDREIHRHRRSALHERLQELRVRALLRSRIYAGPIDLAIASTNGLRGLYEGNRWDYRMTAAYQIQPSINLYGQFATGFKGGGINPRPYYAEQVRSFDPETVDAYEVGLKSDWLERRLRLNVATFYNKYKNMQLTLNELSANSFQPDRCRTARCPPMWATPQSRAWRWSPKPIPWRDW